VVTTPAIRIRDSDRLALFGSTGSGKTYRAIRFLAQHPRWAAIDPKFDLSIPGAEIVKHYNPKLPRQIFRPYGDTPIHEQTERFLWELWRHRLPGVVYADEVNDLSKSPRSISPMWNRIIRQGRGLGVCAWSASQRPVDVPSTVFTESQHFFVFALAWENDREKVESFTTDGVARLVEGLGEFQCVYYSAKSRRAIVLPRAVATQIVNVTRPERARPGLFAKFFARS
jgi:hypothetical protein